MWLHQNFPAKLSQFLLSHQKCVWYGVVMTEDNALSIDQFLIAFPESIDSIALVVDSKN